MNLFETLQIMSENKNISDKKLLKEEFQPEYVIEILSDEPQYIAVSGIKDGSTEDNVMYDYFTIDKQAGAEKFYSKEDAIECAKEIMNYFDPDKNENDSNPTDKEMATWALNEFGYRITEFTDYDMGDDFMGRNESKDVQIEEIDQQHSSSELTEINYNKPSFRKFIDNNELNSDIIINILDSVFPADWIRQAVEWCEEELDINQDIDDFDEELEKLDLTHESLILSEGLSEFIQNVGLSPKDAINYIGEYLGNNYEGFKQFIMDKFDNENESSLDIPIEEPTEIDEIDLNIEPAISEDEDGMLTVEETFESIEDKEEATGSIGGEGNYKKSAVDVGPSKPLRKKRGLLTIEEIEPKEEAPRIFLDDDYEDDVYQINYDIDDDYEDALSDVKRMYVNKELTYVEDVENLDESGEKENWVIQTKDKRYIAKDAGHIKIVKNIDDAANYTSKANAEEDLDSLEADARIRNFPKNCKVINSLSETIQVEASEDIKIIDVENEEV